MKDEYHRTCCPTFFWHRHPWGRRFLTKEEMKELKERNKEKKIKWLEGYKESLEKELMGVNERLEEFKKDKK